MTFLVPLSLVWIVTVTWPVSRLNTESEFSCRVTVPMPGAGMIVTAVTPFVVPLVWMRCGIGGPPPTAPNADVSEKLDTKGQSTVVFAPASTTSRLRVVVSRLIMGMSYDSRKLKIE